MNISRSRVYGVAVLALAAVLNASAFYTAERSFAGLHEAAVWVGHSQAVRAMIDQVYRRAVDAETGQRGFLLTQGATYLLPYNEARVEIPKDLATLGELTRDNPVQVAQLVTVKSL